MSFVRFQDDYNTNAKGRGVTRAMAEDVLGAPDHTHQYGTAMPATREESVFYLHLKRQAGETAGMGFAVLVVSGRRADVHTVMDGWRLYHDLFDIPSLQTARDALRAFVDRYGLAIRIGRETGKFLEGLTIPARTGGEIPMFEPAESVPKDAIVSLTALAETLKDPRRLQVTVAYGINETPYRNDIRGRGVVIR